MNNKTIIDKNDVIDSSIEWINQDERIELKETNKIVKKIRKEIEEINYQTSDRILSEVYFGGDGNIEDIPFGF